MSWFQKFNEEVRLNRLRNNLIVDGRHNQARVACLAKRIRDLAKDGFKVRLVNNRLTISEV